MCNYDVMRLLISTQGLSHIPELWNIKPKRFTASCKKKNRFGNAMLENEIKPNIQSKFLALASNT